MSTLQIKFLNAFNNVPDIGVVTLTRIYKYFKGDFERAWQAPWEEFQKAGIQNEELRALEKRNAIDPEKEIKKVFDRGIKILTIADKNYPEPLKHIPHPPILLYVNGEIYPAATKEDEFFFAVVGTRTISAYGKMVTPKIVQELARAGFTIVSGLASGVDALAHRSALDMGKRTIAVLGTGLDRKSFFPQQNWGLAQEITKNGAVISEYPLGTWGTKEKFPQRNRIISGLSKGVLIIEAAQKSGALITANYALQQNRDVFAMPGSIYSRTSQGTNDLIKKGAKLVASGADILEEYNFQTAELKSRIIEPANKIEAAIIKEISQEPTHIDKIVRNSKLSVMTISATLTEMELNGKVKNLGNDTYCLNI